MPVQVCQESRCLGLDRREHILGAVDHSADEPLFACHLFISQMCLLRYSGLVGNYPGYLQHRHRVSYLPVDAATPLYRLPATVEQPKWRWGSIPTGRSSDGSGDQRT